MASHRNYIFNIVLIGLLLVFMVPSITCHSKQPDDDDEDHSDDSKYDNFHKPVDRPDWVDYSDMFTYDPSTKTNRIPKIDSEAASMIIERAKIRNQVDNDGKRCFNRNCDKIFARLRKCEDSQKQSQFNTCDCPSVDDCGARSYQIIRRLLLLLHKQLKDSRNKGSILRMKVNLDNFLFEMPKNINDTSDCDYLAYLHPIADLILPSISIDSPEESYIIEYASFLSFKNVATSLTVILLTIISTARMSVQIRLLALLAFMFTAVFIWEFFYLYQIEVAKAEETTNRLKSKCESPKSSNWFTWLFTSLPSIAFNSENSECSDYYITTRVDPLLRVNPIMVIAKIIDRTFGYSLRLTADTAGVSVALFFSHIPSFWIPFFILAGTCIVIYRFKYSFMYSSGSMTPPPPQKKSKQKAQLKQQKKLLSLADLQSKIKQVSSKSRTNNTSSYPSWSQLSRYGSTGNLVTFLENTHTSKK